MDLQSFSVTAVSRWEGGGAGWFRDADRFALSPPGGPQFAASVALCGSALSTFTCLDVNSSNPLNAENAKAQRLAEKSRVRPVLENVFQSNCCGLKWMRETSGNGMRSQRKGLAQFFGGIRAEKCMESIAEKRGLTL